VWKPLALAPNDLLKGLNFAAIARLSRGATLAQAQAELDAFQRTAVPTTGAGGGNATIAGELTRLRDQITGGSRRGLEVLLAAAGAVLLIACLNVTGLILSRSATRQRELAVRSAIGATGRRLTRQLFTEGLVLSVLSGGLAVAMAGFALRLVVLAAPVDIPRLDEVQLDRDGMLFAAIVTLATTLIVGLLPAWRVPRFSVLEGLKQGTRMTAGGRLPMTASTLVAGQLCATAVCAIVAGLLLQSFVTLLAVDKGFDVANVVTADLELAGSGYAGRRVPFERSLIEQLRSIQGVTAVGLTSQQLLAGAGANFRIVPEGALVPIQERPLANFRSVNADFFRTFRIPIHRGQVFADPDTRPVAVVSAATAVRLWPGENAVGKRFRRGPDNSPPIEVVGVAADVRATALEQPAGLVVYVPYWQAPPAQFSIALQTSADVQTVASAMRDVVRRLDPALPIARLRTMDAVVAESVGERRFLTVLVMLFAAIASLLAAAGVYGVLSQRVTQRTAEIGLRLACGAKRVDVVRLMLNDAWLLTAFGVGGAVPIALVWGSALQAILFEVSPYDGRTIAIVCIVIAAAATAAAYLPARRASRVDAMVALRAD
jgi:putative ABC transport system permease protein